MIRYNFCRIIPLALLIAIVAAMTYPLLLNFSTYLPGFFTTDEPFTAVWNYWRIDHSFRNGTSLGTTDFIAYPFGVDMTESRVPYIWQGLKFILAFFLNPAASYNTEVIINFLLTGLCMYFLMNYLIHNRVASFLSAVIFTFCPQHFIRSWQHLGLTYFQWIPLSFLALIMLKEKGTLRAKSFTFLAFLLLLSFDYSIMYMTIVALAIFLLYSLLNGIRKKSKGLRDSRGEFKFILKATCIAGLVFIVLLPQFLPLIKNRSIFSQDEASAHNRYHRPFEDLFEQSARPLGYLLPAFVHPVFGKFSGQFVSSALYGVSYTEHVLYLGWIPIMLAFYAFRRRKEAADKNFYLNFFLFLTVAAWFISQPPWWKLGPIKIYMPSFFLYRVFSSFRAYCRFGIIVVFAVAALAGFGLKFIQDKIHSNRKKIALGIIVTSLVLFEFWSWPPFKVINIEQVPAVYYWLKEQPGDFVIAEYPLAAQHPSTRYLLYQTKHEKKMINGAVPGSNASGLARSIFKLSEPYTPGVLSYWDVKYVLVHHDDYFRTELVEDREELIKIPKNPGLKFVKRFPAESCPQDNIICMQRTDIIDVYKVIAKPKKPAI